MTGMLLDATNLMKSFGGIQAIADLSLEVEEGELRSLIGPNGAGKSTLFSLLMGIHETDSGWIRFGGEDITSLASFKRVRRGLGLKFQTTRIYRDAGVEENLRIPLRWGSDRELVDLAVSELGLDSSADMPAKELSHAEQQWLELCMVLVTGPRLLLLDEPTSGMTSDESKRTATVLKALNAQGLTVLVVEHDMSFVRELGGETTVLHNGRVFASGDMDEIQADKEVQRIYLGEIQDA